MRRKIILYIYACMFGATAILVHYISKQSYFILNFFI